MRAGRGRGCQTFNLPKCVRMPARRHGGGIDLGGRKIEHGARAVDAGEEVHVVEVRERKLAVLEAGADGP